MRRGTFANLLCAEMGWPVKLHNRRTLQAQMQSEGGNAVGNPFNCVQPMPGSTDYNHLSGGGGVQNYVSAKQGLEATVKTLRGHGFGYEQVVAAMKANKPARETVRLIGASGWGTASTLLVEVYSWIARVPGVLKSLEDKQVAGS